MAIKINNALVAVTPDDPAFEIRPSHWNQDFVWSGLTAGQILYPSDTTTLTSSANLAYSEASGPQLTVGSGSTTLAGWILGYSGASGYAVLGSTTAGAPNSSTNFTLLTNGSDTYLQCGTGGGNFLAFRTGGTEKGNFTNTAGRGLTLTAGTATTDVNALSVTQTWNAAGVTFTAAKIVITDTASAAGSLALQILGGAAGATNLMTLSKAGAIGSGQGTLALPSLTFAGQTNTGLWNTGAIIEFSASATLIARISSGGVFLLGGNTQLSAGNTFGYGSGVAGVGANDTGLSRISAGLWGVGTGAAGSFAGALKYSYTIAAASANNRMTNQKLLYGATTDAATAVELTTDGAAGSGATNRILVPADTTLSCVVNIAVKQSASASAKQMLRQFVISNNGGTTAIQGTVVTLGTDSGTAGLATVTCTITANDTDDAVKIEVNGVLATNLRYTAYVVSTEVLYS